MGHCGAEDFLEHASYPCFLLDKSLFVLRENEAARQPAYRPLLQSGSFENYLTPASRRTLNEGKSAVQPLYLLAYSVSYLTVLPCTEGYFAFLSDSPSREGAPWFSAEVREALDNIFVLLPHIEQALSDQTDGLACTERLAKNCYRILRTNNNITTANALASGHAFSFEAVELSSFLEELCESVRIVCRPTGVPLSFQSGGSCVVNANRYLLELAFTNLLLNSFFYTRDGNEISVALHISGKNALVTVRDRGLGIKPEVLSHLFEPYFSADPYCDGASRPGLGLGLALAFEAVRSMKGRINVESEFGEGSCFSVSLPLTQDAEAHFSSAPSDYLINRYSTVYVQMSPVCRFPHNF
ncbi:MAG: HAMP domain-containing sensor histidine kinase [Oscillospiraceae bacterium]|nr:HAMP domain-containing sensor histidine kinase [Oscillospiraceae bacterium]